MVHLDPKSVDDTQGPFQAAPSGCCAAALATLENAVTKQNNAWAEYVSAVNAVGYQEAVGVGVFVLNLLNLLGDTAQLELGLKALAPQTETVLQALSIESDLTGLYAAFQSAPSWQSAFDAFFNTVTLAGDLVRLLGTETGLISVAEDLYNTEQSIEAPLDLLNAYDQLALHDYQNYDADAAAAYQDLFAYNSCVDAANAGFCLPPPGPGPGNGAGPSPGPLGGNPGGLGNSAGVGSQDPNALYGPVGYGPSSFVGDATPLPYRIDFENAATATAPAQTVSITDQLDPNLDWTTFQLTGIGFGFTNVVIPAGSQYYQTTVSTTDNGQTFNVDITASLNPATGLLTVTFQSIDPKTNLPPTNPLTGFLPPENGTGIGDGYVSFLIDPKSDLSTGTQIRNVALISFDGAPTIATDQVNDDDPSQGVDPTKQALVTIDAGPPSSRVSALPATSPVRASP